MIHPAHQRHAAFAPACCALPSGTAPRKRTFHQGRANPNGAATSRTQFRAHGLSQTRSKHITRYHQSSRSPATRRVYTSMLRGFPYYICSTNWPLLSPAPTNSFPCYICTTNWTLLSPALKLYRMIPPIIPLTSNTPRLHQRVSRSPLTRRHANALSTKAAQIRVALRHHGRNFAPRSATH